MIASVSERTARRKKANKQWNDKRIKADNSETDDGGGEAGEAQRKRKPHQEQKTGGEKGGRRDNKSENGKSFVWNIV